MIALAGQERLAPDNSSLAACSSGVLTEQDVRRAGLLTKETEKLSISAADKPTARGLLRNPNHVIAR
jgi:hypothetical protein